MQKWGLRIIAAPIFFRPHHREGRHADARQHPMSILIHHRTQATMLQTPASFASPSTHREHPHPHTFIFRGDELLLRESDLAQPGLAVCTALAIDNASSHPVGMLDGRYCRAGTQ